MKSWITWLHDAAIMKMVKKFAEFSTWRNCFDDIFVVKTCVNKLSKSFNMKSKVVVFSEMVGGGKFGRFPWSSVSGFKSTCLENIKIGSIADEEYLVDLNEFWICSLNSTKGVFLWSNFCQPGWKSLLLKLDTSFLTVKNCTVKFDLTNFLPDLVKQLLKSCTQHWVETFLKEWFRRTKWTN